MLLAKPSELASRIVNVEPASQRVAAVMRGLFHSLTQSSCRGNMRKERNSSRIPQSFSGSDSEHPESGRAALSMAPAYPFFKKRQLVQCICWIRNAALGALHFFASFQVHISAFLSSRIVGYPSFLNHFLAEASELD